MLAFAFINIFFSEKDEKKIEEPLPILNEEVIRQPNDVPLAEISELVLILYKEESKIEYWALLPNNEYRYVAVSDHCNIDDVKIGVYENIRMDENALDINHQFTIGLHDDSKNYDVNSFDAENWNKFITTKPINKVIVLPNDPISQGRFKPCLRCPFKIQEVYSNLEIEMLDFIK